MASALAVHQAHAARVLPTCSPPAGPPSRSSSAALAKEGEAKGKAEVQLAVGGGAAGSTSCDMTSGAAAEGAARRGRSSRLRQSARLACTHALDCLALVMVLGLAYCGVGDNR